MVNCRAIVNDAFCKRGWRTYAVVDLLATETTDVLDHGGDLCRAAEQDEYLIDRMCCKVVREAIRFEREVLPRSLELRAEAVEPVVHTG